MKTKKEAHCFEINRPAELFLFQPLKMDTLLSLPYGRLGSNRIMRGTINEIFRLLTLLSEICFITIQIFFKFMTKNVIKPYKL